MSRRDRLLRIARHDDERDLPVGERVGNRKGLLLSEVHVEEGRLDRRLLQNCQGGFHACGWPENPAAGLIEHRRYFEGKKSLVFDDKNVLHGWLRQLA